MAQATNTTLGEIKLSGDIMPSDANAPQLTPSGVVPDAYPVVQKIHVDSKGRTLWIGSLSSSELTEDILPFASDTVAGALKLGNPFTTDSTGTLYIADASVSTKGIMKVGTGLYVNQSSGDVDVDLPIGSTTAYGGIKVTNLFNVAGDGTLSVNGAEVLDQLTSPATASSTGVVKVGQYFSNSGALAVDIPNASSSVYGKVKAGIGSGFFGLNASENTLGAVSALAGSPYPGVVLPAADQLYMDTGNGTLNVHACHPSLWGWLYGVSGPNIAIDDATSTLSATYTFDSFVTDATTSVLGRVQVGDRIDVDVNGTISLPNASADYGVVKVTGRVFKIDGNGKLYWDSNYIANSTYAGHVIPNGSTIYFSDLPTATISADLTHTSITASAAQKGQVQIGDGISIDAGVISIPDATTSTNGLVQIGSGINVTNGVISIDTSNLPTASKTELGAFYLHTDQQNRRANFTVTGDVMTPTIAGYYTTGLCYATGDSFVKVVNGVLSYEASYTSAYFIGLAKPGYGLSVDAGGTLYCSQLATASELGICKIDGTSIVPYSTQIGLRIAGTSNLGVVGAGTGINIDSNGLMTVANASESAKGIMIPGTGIAINDTTSVISLTPEYTPILATNNNTFSAGQYASVTQSPGWPASMSSMGNNIFLLEPAGSSNQYVDFNLSGFWPAMGTSPSYRYHSFDINNFTYYFIYKVVGLNGTSTPVQIKFTNVIATEKIVGTSYFGGSASVGDLLVCEMKRFKQGNGWVTMCIKSQIFK